MAKYNTIVISFNYARLTNYDRVETMDMSVGNYGYDVVKVGCGSWLKFWNMVQQLSRLNWSF